MIWFGLTWSLELYQQCNARLHRQGQTDTVVIHHIIPKGTIDRKVWQCSERYKVGDMGRSNRHVDEETLIKAYLMAWNALVENRETFMERWKEQMQSENLLEVYRAEKFIEYTDGAELLKEMDTDFMLKKLDHIKVFEDGTLLVVFLDGTEIECKNKEE